jgi:hypothetical protein
MPPGECEIDLARCELPVQRSPVRSLDAPVVVFVSVKTHTPAATEVYVIGVKRAW